MSRPDNVMYASDDDEDFPIDEKKRSVAPPKQRETKKEIAKPTEALSVDHQNGACIPMGCLCEDSVRIQADKKAATPPAQSNYILIDKLSKNLQLYLEAQKIPGIDELVGHMKTADAPTKLLFIKTYLCPRVKGLRNDIADKVKTATPEQQDKVARFLEAMCSVAEQ